MSNSIQNLYEQLDVLRKNVPDSNFVQYNDLSNIHCYYQMVDKNKHITEILQCIDILQTFLNLVTFMKSGQEIIYSQEHIDLIINSVLNNMINQIVYSEEYGTDYSVKTIVKKLTFNENNM